MSAMGISIDRKWTDYQAHVRDELKTGAVTLPTSANALLNEPEVYEYDKTESGRVRYSAPPGFHDDCVDALTLAADTRPKDSGKPSGTGTW